MKIKLDAHLCKNIALDAVRTTFRMLSQLVDSFRIGLFHKKTVANPVHVRVAMLAKHEPAINSLRDANQAIDGLNKHSDFKNTKGI